MMIVPGLLINVSRGDLDRAAVSLYFIAGFFCISWLQMVCYISDTLGISATSTYLLHQIEVLCTNFFGGPHPYTTADKGISQGSLT